MILVKEISKIHYAILASIGLFACLLLWAAISYSGFVPALFLPTPIKVISTAWALFASGGLMGDIWASVYRMILSCLLSLLVALPLGIALGISRKIEAYLEPIISFVRYIPPSAFVPLAIIWFGIGEGEKVAILFLAVAPYLALLIAGTVANTRHELVEAALTLGAKRFDVIAKVIIPHALPGIWDSFRIMIGAAWSFVIIAEIVGSSSGLGHLMVESQRFLRTDTIFAVILVIGFLGLGTDYFFKTTHRLLFSWAEKLHA